MRHQVLIAVIFLIGFRLAAQIGGDNTYEFLNINHSAFAAATGGITISQSRGDLSLPYHNPALLTSDMRQNLTLSYSRYFADINYGYAAWAFGQGVRDNFAAGLSYINYGSFTEADESGNITGDFKAAEYTFTLMYSRRLDSLFTIGIDVKPLLSHLERYFSAGICADIGVTYTNTNLLFTAGFVIKNAGFQIKTYTGEKSEPLPFEIQAGITKSLSHAPFRFSLTLRHLEKFDMTYDYDTTDDTEAGGAGEDILRHIVLGIELLPANNFWAGAGFNYQRRAEMRTTGKTGTAGLSWGFGFNAKAFTFAYGRDTYHLVGSANHLTMTFFPDRIFKNHRR